MTQFRIFSTSSHTTTAPDTYISSITIPSTVEWIGLDAFSPSVKAVLLNPDCHMETEDEYILRINDEDNE